MVAGPRVSVIIPSYNHARYLERCLTSVFTQTYDNAEVIAIDDGSTDDSLCVLQRLANQSPFPMTVYGQGNKGAAFTINRGIRLSSGDYVNILNSDDAFTPDRIATLFAQFRGCDSEFIFSRVQFMDEADNDVSLVDDYAIDLVSKQSAINDFMSVGFSAIRSNVAISTGNFFFSRQLYERVGPFAEFRYCHDWDFLLRCLVHVEPVYVAQPLYWYRLHSRNSFRDLAEAAGYECPTLMRNYFRSVRRGIVPNALAPCYQNWGEYFWSFIDQNAYWPYVNVSDQS
jgi:glycosyltransferase involved in cell wall biosynthesis